MTDNDAAKALESLRTKICLLPTSIQACSKVDIETISIELAKSAKVDGLLTALLIAKRDFKNWISNKEAREAAIASIDKAIQRFNGEV